MNQLRFRLWKKDQLGNGVLCSPFVMTIQENTLLYSPFKDHEGEQICEGDILKYEYLQDDLAHDYFEVIFCTEVGAFQSGRADGDWQYLWEDLDHKDTFRITIAGNIVEHAHLLDNKIYKPL
jgi:hypothetical protein